MFVLLFAVPVAVAAAPPPDGLAEAAHAIEVGRVDQARTMVNVAVSKGAAGDRLDRVMADLAFAEGNFANALARYQALLTVHPGDARMAERAGMAALQLRQLALAISLLDKAIVLPGASWRAWNARGVAADLQADWATADKSYAQAGALAPDSAQVANNVGWSLLVRGEWQAAVTPLERAAALDPKSPRIADNLELARAAVADDLPRQRPGESNDSWAARLNDAGVILNYRGERKRAVAAFAQALEARSVWFDRAANNLALAEGKK